jgi:hypothetical protein
MRRTNLVILLALISSGALTSFPCQAEQSHMSQALFEGHLNDIKAILIEDNAARKKHDDLVSNPDRPDGFVQFNKDAAAFRSMPGCHYYNGDVSSCQWYIDKANALKARKEALEEEEARSKAEVERLDNLFLVHLHLLNHHFSINGCPQSFADHATACAQMAPEPAANCLAELWTNHVCKADSSAPRAGVSHRTPAEAIAAYKASGPPTAHKKRHRLPPPPAPIAAPNN